MSTIHSNHSFQSVTSLVNRFVDDLLVKILPAGAHSVLEILQIGNGNAIHALLQSPPYSVVNGVQVQAVRGPYRRFDEVRHRTLQELHG